MPERGGRAFKGRGETPGVSQREGANWKVESRGRPGEVLGK